jgi:2-polyprenyl-3-methyl-5-hydroxy-6-metoxy-1,4-benzoquinol methylase
MNTRTRLPHVVLDHASRVQKARKIIELIGHERFQRAKRILEVGCGSGVISSTLATLGGAELDVQAVDVRDNRLIEEGFEFTLVSGTQLPFESQGFDVVISNHVIEHVGDHNAQMHHLSELHRVLKDDGMLYLAVPNKWRLIEPHFRLPFLSWFPLVVADRYVRWTGKGQEYDCVPLSRNEALHMLADSRFACRDMTFEAIEATLRIEFAGSAWGRLVAENLPRPILAATRPVISTLIFTGVKSPR